MFEPTRLHSLLACVTSDEEVDQMVKALLRTELLRRFPDLDTAEALVIERADTAELVEPEADFRDFLVAYEKQRESRAFYARHAYKSCQGHAGFREYQQRRHAEQYVAIRTEIQDMLLCKLHGKLNGMLEDQNSAPFFNTLQEDRAIAAFFNTIEDPAPRDSVRVVGVNILRSDEKLGVAIGDSEALRYLEQGGYRPATFTEQMAWFLRKFPPGASSMKLIRLPPQVMGIGTAIITNHGWFGSQFYTGPNHYHPVLQVVRLAVDQINVVGNQDPRTLNPKEREEQCVLGGPEIAPGQPRVRQEFLQPFESINDGVKKMILAVKK